MQLSSEAAQFLTERHLGTLTTLRPDGTPHVTPVGFTWDADAGIARIITSGTSRKTAYAASAGAVVALCQVEGGRWLTLEGPARVVTDPVAVADAEARYTRRYRSPRPNPRRVVIEVSVRRAYGRPDPVVR